MKFPYLLTLGILFLALPAPSQAFRVDGMKTPESFIRDPVTGMYYISNINGRPTEKDNNGFIIRLDPAGKPESLRFIAGGRNNIILHAPRGLALTGNNLYVTDIDAVRRFDKQSGKLLGSIDMLHAGAKFLNDITVDPEGTLYISDTVGNTIYKIDPAKDFQVTNLVRSMKLGNPKGLVYDPTRKRLVVAAGGSGRILAVEFNGTIYPLVTRKFKGLDGIDFDREGSLIVSDHKAGKVYRITNYSQVETLRENIVTPANVSHDFRDNQILIPSSRGNLVFTLPVK